MQPTMEACCEHWKLCFQALASCMYCFMYACTMFKSLLLFLLHLPPYGEELLTADGLGTPKFRCWSPNL